MSLLIKILIKKKHIVVKLIHLALYSEYKVINI